MIGHRGCASHAADTTLSAAGPRLFTPQPRSAAMNTEQVAKRLVELCRQGRYTDAHEELFAQDAVNIEMEGSPPGAMSGANGLEAIKQKGRAFGEMVEAVHSNEVSDPVIAGNWFSAAAVMDATMKGRGRVTMREICVYHVRDGKIDREQFFYDM